jgi:hypothetical protein
MLHIVADCVGVAADAAFAAACCGQRAVALYDAVRSHAARGLDAVHVLSEAGLQLGAAIELTQKEVREGGREALSGREKARREGKECSRIRVKVRNVEDALGLRQREFSVADAKLPRQRVQPILAPKVRDTTRRRHPSAGEDDDLLREADRVYDMLEIHFIFF